MKEHYDALVAQARLNKIQNFKAFCKLAQTYKHTGISLKLYSLSRFFLYYSSTCKERTPELIREHVRIVKLNKKINKVNGNS